VPGMFGSAAECAGLLWLRGRRSTAQGSVPDRFSDYGIIFLAGA